MADTYLDLPYTNSEVLNIFSLVDNNQEQIAREPFEPNMSLPAIIYVAIDRELNLWHRALYSFFPGINNISMRASCAEGYAKERSYRLTPVATGDLALTIYGLGENGETLETVVSTIKKVAKDNGSGTKQLLFVGDSLFAGGETIEEISSLITTDGGITATFLGNRGDTVKYEARGGWTTTDLSTVGARVYYEFTVSGVTIAPLEYSKYTHNSSTYQVEEIHLSAGSGTLVCYRLEGSTTPDASGTLTKISGTGDATISFSANEEVSGNPFWNDISEELDFQNYMSEGGFAGNIDYYVLQIGINDLFNANDNVAQAIANIKIIIDALLDAGTGYPNCEIILSIPPISAATLDAFSFNYGASRDWVSYYINMRNYFEALITNFDAGAYNANVSICFSAYWVDRDYSYPTTTEDRSARDTTELTVQYNFVHPSQIGYEQIADAIYSHIRGLLS